MWGLVAQEAQKQIPPSPAEVWVGALGAMGDGMQRRQEQQQQQHNQQWQWMQQQQQEQQQRQLEHEVRQLRRQQRGY